MDDCKGFGGNFTTGAPLLAGFARGEDFDLRFKLRKSSSMLPRSSAPLLLIFVAIALAFIALLLHPIPQPLSYHNFADHRA